MVALVVRRMTKVAITVMILVRARTMVKRNTMKYGTVGMNGKQVSVIVMMAISVGIVMIK